MHQVKNQPNIIYRGHGQNARKCGLYKLFTDVVDISPVNFYLVRTCYQTVDIDFFDHSEIESHVSIFVI